ncbi:MAG: hypothetical protein SynsKO_30100 [Synoicihabitans sp.]
MNFLARIILIGLVGPLTAVAATEQFEVVEALPYSQADPICRLDLYLPSEATAPVPCVIVIQGGGFRAQNGQKFKPFAEHLARQGIAAALIGYRGLPDHTYTKTVSDVKTAARFLRKISGDHGIDPDRIGAMGRSAGATLAALAVTTRGKPAFLGRGEHSSFSSRIQAVVGIAGVYDFVARFVDEDQRALQPNLDAKMLSNDAWIGTPFSANDPRWEKASASTHIDKNDPPMLLLQSRDDNTVPWMQSRNFHDQLVAAGVAAEWHLAESGGHAGPVDSKARMVAFFRRVLSNPD